MFAPWANTPLNHHYASGQDSNNYQSRIDSINNDGITFSAQAYWRFANIGGEVGPKFE